MNHIKSIIMALALTSPQIFAANDLDIFQIYTQFAISDAVSQKCINPDNAIYDKFLENYKAVSFRASQEFKKMYPSFTEAQTVSAMKERNVLINNQVSKLVIEKGCDDPMLQEAVKRFYVQANWKP